VSLTIRPACTEDCRELAPLLRAADLAEVRAEAGLDGLEALLVSVERSEAAYAVDVDGKLGAIFGHRYVNLMANIGQVWCLTGHAMEKRPIAFLHSAMYVCDELLKKYGELVACIDARYTKAVRFFTLVGFQMAPAVPLEPGGALFHLATMRRK
jgi:hypothetical protein